RSLIAASVEDRGPRWRAGRGWVTAEYAMLPGSTDSRTARDRRGVGGRAKEIERLVGRSLRAAVDLDALPDVTVTVDVSENDGDTVTVRGTFSYFDGRVTEALTPVAGGSISGDSVLVNGDGTATFTLRLSNDNYDDTVEVAVNAADSEGTDYDWMIFLTEPCGVTPTTTTTTTTLPNTAPAGTLTATCTLSGKTFTIQALAKVVDDDGDTVTVTASARPTSSFAIPLSPTSGVEVKGGAGNAALSGSFSTSSGKDFVVSARFDDGRDSYSPPSYPVSCP
ncbi:MAG: hypothetical protein ACO4B6_03595, partial [Ilumatobacteraceae bacterium]